MLRGRDDVLQAAAARCSTEEGREGLERLRELLARADRLGYGDASPVDFALLRDSRLLHRLHLRGLCERSRLPAVRRRPLRFAVAAVRLRSGRRRLDGRRRTPADRARAASNLAVRRRPAIDVLVSGADVVAARERAPARSCASTSRVAAKASADRRSARARIPRVLIARGGDVRELEVDAGERARRCDPQRRALRRSAARLRAAGIDVPDDVGRKLAVTRRDGTQILFLRPTDVPAYVEFGAADCGIVGSDVLVGNRSHVCELADLGFGSCRLVVAARRIDRYHEGAPLPTFLRVATKFERSAEAYFSERDLPVELIPLHGSVELSPLVGLADLIVDLVATGNTLREHDMVIVGRDRAVDRAFRRQSGPLPRQVRRAHGAAWRASTAGRACMNIVDAGDETRSRGSTPPAGIRPASRARRRRRDLGCGARARRRRAASSTRGGSIIPRPRWRRCGSRSRRPATPNASFRRRSRRGLRAGARTHRRLSRGAADRRSRVRRSRRNAQRAADPSFRRGRRLRARRERVAALDASS